jgi:hypothetical protein
MRLASGLFGVQLLVVGLLVAWAQGNAVLPSQQNKEEWLKTQLTALVGLAVLVCAL